MACHRALWAGRAVTSPLEAVIPAGSVGERIRVLKGIDIARRAPVRVERDRFPNRLWAARMAPPRGWHRWRRWRLAAVNGRRRRRRCWRWRRRQAGRVTRRRWRRRRQMRRGRGQRKANDALFFFDIGGAVAGARERGLNEAICVRWCVAAIIAARTYADRGRGRTRGVIRLKAYRTRTRRAADGRVRRGEPPSVARAAALPPRGRCRHAPPRVAIEGVPRCTRAEHTSLRHHLTWINEHHYSTTTKGEVASGRSHGTCRRLHTTSRGGRGVGVVVLDVLHLAIRVVH